MSNPAPSLHVAVFGTDETTLEGGRGCGLWPSGYAAALQQAGATPRMLGDATRGKSWDDLLAGAHGVILTGRPTLTVTFDPEDDTGSAAGGGNTTAAARVVNAIPFVCAAPPGMLDALQVPLPIGRGLVG